ncbi:MAG: uroporphyrinogen decarboxylase family protein [Burkholderiales bacterium]
MNKRARVLAAIRGEPVDRVPVSFWLHNYASEYSAQALTDETVRLYQAFDWDFLKPQSRASCFAEMWGGQIESSTQQTVKPTTKCYALHEARELGTLQAADASKGALAEQLQAMLAIRTAVGSDVPIVATIFAPLMVATYLLPGGRNEVLRLLREDPAALEHGLAAIGATLADYARNCVTAGIDGIFYATTVATEPLLTAAECRRFQRPYDLAILEAAAAAPFNIMHVCGDNTRFDEFVDYPVSVFSWATTPGNPTLVAARELTGRAVLGGLPGKPQIGSMRPEALVESARVSIAQTKGRKHLLGPDCSINPGTPDPLLHAVSAAVARMA